MLRKRAALGSSGRDQTSRNMSSMILCILTCFSGGVFLATCFLHLFPELNHFVDQMKKEHHLNWDYPMAELLSCVGFFVLFFIEEVVLIIIPGAGHGHSHGGNKSKGGKLQLTMNKPIDEHSVPMLSANSSNSGTSDGHHTHHDNHTHHHYDSQPKSAKRNSHGHEVSSTEQVERCDVSCRSVTLAEPERCEINCEKVDEHPPILMKSHPHNHSHGVRSITFLLAISFHSVIEGLALGVQDKQATLVTLFVSLLIHKLIVAFSMGLQFARTHAHSLKLVYISIAIFAVMTPFGAIIGIFVKEAPMDAFIKDIVILIFQGLAVGTFLYVTFFEVLLHERDNEHNNLLKLVFMVIGFTTIGMFRFFDTHTHDSGHSHSHDDGPH
uniref:Zinc transporter ZIP3 n=1 Tax=Rhabditophanes sp. KR3021 TaxID=114890 RepID=A0AC35TV82_9BILA